MRSLRQSISGWMTATGFLVVLYGVPQGLFIYFAPVAMSVEPPNATVTALALSMACLSVGGILMASGAMLREKKK